MMRLMTRWHFWQGGIIFILCILCYSNSMMNGFMLDDHSVLFPTAKPIRFDLSIFQHNVNGFYRPVSIAFLRSMYLLIGADPFWYHVVNLFLFFVICILFLLIARHLFINTSSNPFDKATLNRASLVSFVSVVLYCTHPINNMIVNYVTACLVAVFVICMQASLFTFLVYLDGQKKFYYYLSIFFYSCSLLSHEMSSILPLYLLMVLYYFKGQRIKTALSVLGPYLLCLVFYIFLWYHMSSRQHMMGGVFKVPFAVYFASIMQLLGWYLSKLFFPHHILFLWDVLISDNHTAVRLAEFIFLMGFVAGLYFFLVKFKKKFEVFSLTLFLIGFIPIGIASFAYTSYTKTALIEPHWFYFSSIGFFMLLASFLVSLTEHWMPWLKISSLCVLVLLLALMTRQSNQVWKDERTYCKYWIMQNPLNGVPYQTIYMMNADAVDSCNHGLQMAQQGKYAQAIADFNKAINIRPDFFEAYDDRGICYAQEGNFFQAQADYNRAIAINPKKGEGYYNRAVNYFKLKEYDNAWRDVHRAEVLGINNPKFISILRQVSGQDQ